MTWMSCKLEKKHENVLTVGTVNNLFLPSLNKKVISVLFC